MRGALALSENRNSSFTKKRILQILHDNRRLSIWTSCRKGQLPAYPVLSAERHLCCVSEFLPLGWRHFPESRASSIAQGVVHSGLPTWPTRLEPGHDVPGQAQGYGDPAVALCYRPECRFRCPLPGWQKQRLMPWDLLTCRQQIPHGGGGTSRAPCHIPKVGTMRVLAAFLQGTH